MIEPSKTRTAGKLFFLSTIILLTGCLTAGTHGSIKTYEYRVSVTRLQITLDSILKNNTNIFRDTTQNYILDITGGKNDTIIDNRYNDGKNYFTFEIKTPQTTAQYTLYIKDETNYTDSSKGSSISVVYAFDEKGNGGSEGNGDFNWRNKSLKNRLLNNLEKELISKIDIKLNSR